MGTILLGCDDAGVQATLAAEIEGLGHNVVEAASGIEVLEVAAATQPDVVILSPTLPVFDGLETARMLRADPDYAPDLPIVLLESDAIHPRAAESAGISEILPTAHSTADIADLLARLVRPEAMPDR